MKVLVTQDVEGKPGNYGVALEGTPLDADFLERWIDVGKDVRAGFRRFADDAQIALMMETGQTVNLTEPPRGRDVIPSAPGRVWISLNLRGHWIAAEGHLITGGQWRSVKVSNRLPVTGDGREVALLDPGDGSQPTIFHYPFP